MKKSKLLFILSSFVIITFILGTQYLNYQNKSNSDLKSKFDLYLYKYDDFENELPVINLQQDHADSLDIESIDRASALEDIDYFFSLLKYGYSGYEYFGGDEKFDLAKKDIITLVNELNTDHIPVDKFLDIIYSKLGFIQDAHFFMGNTIYVTILIIIVAETLNFIKMMMDSIHPLMMNIFI